jgi:CheY-like chemotaxis protein
VLVRNLGSTPRVQGDHARLSHVFFNLLVNAAQAIEGAAVDRNEIRVSTFTDAAGRAVIEVRDSGRGIDPRVRSRVFDPFFTTKPVGVGTGLGLAIAHGIVAQHGGEIWIESSGPLGTAVRVALPPVPVAAGREIARISPPARGARRGRVLVVDDDAAAARVLVRVLSGDHDVVDVRSGRDALGKLTAGERFDVVFCDLMMPEMTGMELHGELCGLGLDVVDRMVFMTGGAFTAGARAFLERLSTPWVEKPFDTQSIRALARRLVPSSG